jgi:micrococcal nuclease
LTDPLLPLRTARLAVLVLFIILGSSTAARAAELSGRVTWIYDGDTIRVERLGKVRLLGIDAPELEASARDSYYLQRGLDRPALRRIAREALNFNLHHLKGKQVILKPDHPRRDDYGRVLACVHLPDGRMINLMLIENGLAAVYRRYRFESKERFLQAEQQARREKRGLWRNAPPLP